VSATLVARGLEAAHGDRLLFSGLDLVGMLAAVTVNRRIEVAGGTVTSR
jgi:hypothetical protein